MKKMKTAKMLSLLMALMLLLQLLPLGTAMAAEGEPADAGGLVTVLPEDEGALDTGNDIDVEAAIFEGDIPDTETSGNDARVRLMRSAMDISGKEWLKIHNTNGNPSIPVEWESISPSLTSSLVIKNSDGTITPTGNTYPPISAGSTIELQVAFHLLDRVDGVDTYQPGDYFYVDLPNGIDFQPIGSSYFGSWGRWELDGNKIKVTLTDQLVSTDYELWGRIRIDGTFLSREDGDGADGGTIKLGDQTYTITRENYEPPELAEKQATLSKNGKYDASRNVIDWVVTINAPDDMDLNGAKFIDTLLSSNHEYVAGSFRVGLNGADPSTIAPDLEGTSWTHTFSADADPAITSATISYSTTPKNGLNFSVNQTFRNKAELDKDSKQYATPVIGETTVPAIFTKGGQADPIAADPSRIKWEVKVTIPSLSPAGEVTLLNATITDKMDSRLDRLASPAPQIQFGTDTPVDVTAVGTLSDVDSDNSFTFKFNDSQIQTGTVVKLIYYTSVKPGVLESVLEDNGRIAFSNDASFTWELPTGDGIIGGNTPNIGASVEKSIASGGLLNKTVDGHTLKSRTVTYDSQADGKSDYINWVVTVNTNRITMNQVTLTDIVPEGHKLVIDNDKHKFIVTRYPSTGDADETTYTGYTDDSALTITGGEAGRTGFGYRFGPPTNDKYTFEFWTEMDATGKNELYTKDLVSLKNHSILEYWVSGEKKTASSSAQKTFTTDMLQKADGGYKYDSRTAEWTLTVNKSRLLMTNAVIADVLPKTSDSPPIQMILVGSDISAFTVKVNGTEKTDHGITIKSTTLVDGHVTGFELALPHSTEDTFEITYKTTLPDSARLAQWTGNKTFENNATLKLDEKPAGYLAKDSVSISNPVVKKTGTYKQNDAQIEWIIDINPGLIDLNNAQIVDTMSPSNTLELDSDSVTLYKVGVNSNGTLKESDRTPANRVTRAADPDSKESTEYALIVNDADSFTIKLPNGRQAYQLVFTTSVIVDTVNISNHVSMSGTTSPTGENTNTSVHVTNQFASGGKGNYQLKIKKVNTDTPAKVIEGAVFKLVTTTEADFKQNGTVITATTGPDGIATFSGLPGWNFYVEEITPAHGYLMPSSPNSPRSVDTYKPVKSNSVVHQLVITNELGFTDVVINKVGVENTPLSSGTFELYKVSDNSVVATATANDGVAVPADKGKVVFANIPVGDYYIKETVAPEGHVLDDATKISVKVDYTPGTGKKEVRATYSTSADGTYTAAIPTFTNTPKNTDEGGNPSISFIKYGANKKDEAGTVLGGVTFELKKENGDIVQTQTSVSETGKVTFTNIPYGTYYIYETVPEGYLNPNTDPAATPIYRVDVSYNSDNTGLRVRLYEDEHLVYDTEPDSGSDEALAQPPVFINYAAVADVEFTKLSSREPEPEPSASPDPTIPMNGGTFEIRGIPLNPVQATPGETDDGGNALYVATASADSGNGNKVVFENVPVSADGEFYTIEEISPPPGYLKTSEKLYVKVEYTDNNKTDTKVVFVDEDGEPTSSADAALINDPAPYIPNSVKITVLKTDEDGAKLPGASFTLYDSAGTAVATAVSDADGIAAFTNVPGDASYTIRETHAPEGYALSTEVISVSTLAGSTLSFTMVNKKLTGDKGSIVITKTDENGVLLPGASFTLYDADCKTLATAASDAAGAVRFTDIPAGSYTIRETAAPEGYVLSTEVLSITLEKDANRSFTFINRRDEVPGGDPAGSIGLLKVNSSGQRLSGAEFGLYDAAGALVARALTGADGIARFTGLPFGSYSIRETVAPAGYKLFEGAQAVEITAANPDRSFTLRNTRDDEPEIGGWEEIPDGEVPGGPGTPGGKLPQTGGVPRSLFLLFAGLALLGAGIFLLKGQKKRGTAVSHAKK